MTAEGSSRRKSDARAWHNFLSALTPLEAPPLERDPTLLLGARWRAFGRHTFYGNGQPRPLLRGWIHCLALVYGMASLSSCEAGSRPLLCPLVLHGRALDFTAWTLLGYLGSVVFHLCPWATLRAYTLALCLDFLTISWSMTGQISSLTGWTHPVALLSCSLSLWVVGLCYFGLRESQSLPLWEYKRDARKVAMLTQIGISCLVEAVLITPPSIAVGIGLCKLFTFQWFAWFARFDAPYKSGLVVKGLWGEHDSFHMLATGTHLLQIWAIARQVRW